MSMKSWLSRIVKIVDFFRVALLIAFAVAWATKYEYGFLIFGGWFLLTIISGLLDITRIKEPLSRLPAYLSGFRSKRKAELPWIAAIGIVNAGFFTAGLWYVSEITNKDERRSMAETMATVTILVNFALFGLMYWSLKIANAPKTSK